ncbi:hypothetical protein HNR30_008841 [Nonomuraea soli]|uniref:Uncharacterized protein n=1 Tax=Nonomuraea soli TaxID=1032476 RepID=A0A7W0HVQ4_9ACTN|nr:hypothetical protein [Nonomuraea soli]
MPDQRRPGQHLARLVPHEAFNYWLHGWYYGYIDGKYQEVPVFGNQYNSFWNKGWSEIKSPLHGLGSRVHRGSSGAPRAQ